MSSSHQEARFSRREWLMVIALLLIIEAWVLHIGYVFHTQEAVISYVSFAATIASLLLAVIAIIYGFYQSDGQQKTAAAMAMQIHAMKDVQGELTSASDGIAGQLTAITSVASDLTILRNSLEGTHQTLGQIRSEQDEVKRAIAIVQRDLSKQIPEVKENAGGDARLEDTPPNIVAVVLKRSGAYMALLSVALSEAVKHPGAHPTGWTDFISKHYAEPMTALEKKPASLVIFTTAGLELMMVLTALGVVVFTRPAEEDGTHFRFHIHERYHETIHQAAEAAMKRKSAIDRGNAISASFN